MLVDSVGSVWFWRIICMELSISPRDHASARPASCKPAQLVDWLRDMLTGVKRAEESHSSESSRPRKRKLRVGMG